jgi:hypothetical protein
MSPPDGDSFEGLVFPLFVRSGSGFCLASDLSAKVKPYHKTSPEKDPATYSNPVSRTTFLYLFLRHNPEPELQAESALGAFLATVITRLRSGRGS